MSPKKLPTPKAQARGRSIASQRKRKSLSVTRASVERKSKRLKLETSSPNNKPRPSENKVLSKGSKRKSRLPAGKWHVKTPENMSYLFRNCHIELDHPSQTSCETRATDTTVKEVIVIDDDDPSENCESEIETVGKCLQDLVSGDEKHCPTTEPSKTDKENLHDTIILDDTQPLETDDTLSDSIMILENEPSQESVSVQDIASKYYTPDTSIEFISINSHSVKPTAIHPSAKKRKKQNSGHPASIFNPNRAPDCNFTGQPTPRHVYKLSGNQGSSEAAVSNPASTMYSDGKQEKTGRRPIVIDGSNIAFAHGRSQNFSVRGIEMVVQYFIERGHNHVVAFLPQFRFNNPEHRETLKKMEIDGNITFTPSRKVDGKYISSYDDRMILDYATEKGAIVISRDNYRDLYQENAHYHTTIEKRILMPTFVGDTLIFPQDPLGRNGPRLDDFLKF